MRIALLGTVESTAVALRELVAGGRPPAALLTLDPGRSARHSDYVDLVPEARRLGVPTVAVPTARSAEVVDQLRSNELDLLLVVGWSEILPSEVLEAARHGAIGYHPSALPEMRGRAVIPWTILLGLAETGSTMFWLTAGLDDGEIAYQRSFQVAARETSTGLYGKHMEALAGMVRELTQAPGVDAIPRRSQEGVPSFCAQRRPVDGLLDWTVDADAVDRMVRASTRPYPGARSFLTRGDVEVLLWACTPVDPPYHGLPGQVVALEGGRPLVTCGSGAIWIDEATDTDGGPVGLRVQDRFLPLPLALQRWAHDRPL
jgi:methionyl-tRNA formyltransferase